MASGTFTDWTAGGWQRRYVGERARCVRLPGPGRGSLVPMTLEIDGTAVEFKAERIVLERTPGHFSLPRWIEEVTEPGFAVLREPADGRWLFDGAVARLAGLEEVDGRVTLLWQPVGFFAYVRTNLMMDWRDPGGHCLRERVHGGGLLTPLGNSPLANAVGISTLLFTADGHLVIQRRSDRVMAWPGVWGSSAAGMLDVDDVAHARTLAELCPRREIAEELGLDGHILDDLEPEFLGLGRELVRGGMPELMFAAKLPVPMEAILEASRNAPDRHEFSRLAEFTIGTDEDPIRLRERLGAFAREIAPEANTPLTAALALWACKRLGEPAVSPAADEPAFDLL